jgi:hypothetical protein
MLELHGSNRLGMMLRRSDTVHACLDFQLLLLRESEIEVYSCSHGVACYLYSDRCWTLHSCCSFRIIRLDVVVPWYSGCELVICLDPFHT